MWKKLVALVLALSLPTGGSAGPLKEAAAKAAQTLASAPREDTRSRARFWTGLALVGGGAVLSSVGGMRLGGGFEDEGPGDEPDDDADEVEDSDGSRSGGAMLAGGIAAASLGSYLLLTGRKGPVVSVGPGGVAVRHTVRF
jgi:hypothetical protein